VHGFVLKGEWRHLEHDWVASEGGYVYEAPGETHTLVVEQPLIIRTPTRIAKGLEMCLRTGIVASPERPTQGTMAAPRTTLVQQASGSPIPNSRPTAS
jgi:hypothetical protein